MKKIIALVLALVMVLSLSTVAFAYAKQPNEFSAIDRVGEVAANLTARALQVPALVSGIALDLNRNAIVTGVNATGAVTYYGAEAAANVLDFAVAVSSGVAKAKVDLAGGVAAFAAGSAAKILRDASGYEEEEIVEKGINALKKEEDILSDEAGNNTLADLAAELFTVKRNILDLTAYADKVIDRVPEVFDKVVDTVFNGTITDMLNLIPGRKVEEAPIATVALVGEELSGIAKGEGWISEPIGLKYSMLLRPLILINRAVGGLTLEQLLVPGKWQEAYKEKIPTPDYVPAAYATMDKINNTVWHGYYFFEDAWRMGGRLDKSDLSSTGSYLAALVNKTISAVAAELKDSSNFSEMNGDYDYELDVYNKNGGVTGSWNDSGRYESQDAYYTDLKKAQTLMKDEEGGDVAEGLFRIGYNLFHRVFKSEESVIRSNYWDGVVPSEYDNWYKNWGEEHVYSVKGR